MAKEESKTKKTAVKKTTTKKTTAAKKATPAKKTTTTKKAAPKKAAPKAKVEKKSPVLVQEENSYGRMIGALILILIALVACYFGYQYKTGNLDLSLTKYVQTEDEKKFQSEYEALNGTANDSGIFNKTLDVMEDNNVVYLSLSEAEEMLEKGSGVIYFGFASCPWCRNLLPNLLQAVKDTKLETLYYVNLLDEDGNDIRSKYVLNEKGKVKKEKDGSIEYYNILALLSEHLSDYVLLKENGKTVSTPEKRLSAPTVVSVKDGNILDLYEITIEMTDKDQGASKVVTKEDEKNALEAYKELIKKYQNNECTEEGC